MRRIVIPEDAGAPPPAVDDSTDLLVHCGVTYENKFGANHGTMYIGAIGLDLGTNKRMYLVAYQGNSGERSILELPMPGNSRYSASTGKCEDTGMTNVRCLYGHPSIESGKYLVNRDCSYQGWGYDASGEFLQTYTGYSARHDSAEDFCRLNALLFTAMA